MYLIAVEYLCSVCVCLVCLLCVCVCCAYIWILSRDKAESFTNFFAAHCCCGKSKIRFMRFCFRLFSIVRLFFFSTTFCHSCHCDDGKQCRTIGSVKKRKKTESQCHGAILHYVHIHIFTEHKQSQPPAHFCVRFNWKRTNKKRWLHMCECECERER